VAGHEVTFGVRDPQADKVQTMLQDVGHGAKAAATAMALEGADVVLFAIPGRAMDETVATMGRRLNGKILIDATNNIGRSPMHSLGVLRQIAPGSPIFRAFSNLGWENFARPELNGVKIDLFYCGDGGDEQRTMDELIADVGLRPVHIGGSEHADIVDALTRLWFILVQQNGGDRRLALKLHTNKD
jgi:predicted dinucleotide-binding enzyme